MLLRVRFRSSAHSESLNGEQKTKAGKVMEFAK
jgi:hypothetical protein